VLGKTIAPYIYFEAQSELDITYLDREKNGGTCLAAVANLIQQSSSVP